MQRQDGGHTHFAKSRYAIRVQIESHGTEDKERDYLEEAVGRLDFENF